MFLPLLVVTFCFGQLLAQDLLRDLDRMTQDLRRLTDRIERHRRHSEFHYHDYNLATDEYFKELLKRLETTNKQQQDTLKKLFNHVEKMTRMEERLREAERQAERNKEDRKKDDKKNKNNNKNNNKNSNNNKKNNNNRRNGRLVPLPF